MAPTVSAAGPTLDPIIPFHVFPESRDQQIEAMVRLAEATQVRRFVLTYPDLGVRIDGMASREQFAAFAELLAETKRRVAPHGIDVGWWCAPSLTAGGNPHSPGHPDFDGYDVQHIVSLDGATSASGCCPLDERFGEWLAGNVALVADRARPFVVFFEDDFQVTNHPGVTLGCFCERHLEFFAALVGVRYSREELRSRFVTGDAASAELRRHWAWTSRDSLVALSRRIRAAVDAVAPQTRLALCQSGVSDIDGDFTEPVVRALAGATRPMVRLYGSSYSSDHAASLPETIFHFLHSRQRLGADVECLHESDTYPHTRFFMSAAKLEALVTCALLYGSDDSLLYIAQYLDNPGEDEAYATMVRRSLPRLNALKQAARPCRVIGVHTPYRPLSHVFSPLGGGGDGSQIHRPGSSCAFPPMLGLMGVPYTAEGGRPTAISGEMTLDLSDEELDEMFRGGVLLDGKAAWHLAQRGRGDLLGVEVRVDPTIRCLYEGLTDACMFPNRPVGRLMYNMAVAPAGSEGGRFFSLSAGPGTAVLSEFLSASLEPLTAAWTLHENRLGGRTAITAFDLQWNRSASVYNYRRKWMLRHTLEWLARAPLPVYVEQAPNAFCIASESPDGAYAVVAVTNLSTDDLPALMLSVQDAWAGRDIQRLDEAGRWQEVVSEAVGSFGTESQALRLQIPARLLRPVVLRFRR